MNAKLLKAKLAENGMNVECLATKMGLNPCTVYNKINKDGFKTTEALTIGRVLHLSSVELCDIFFA